MTPHLFVYGTLRVAAKTKWSRYLAAASRLIGEGQTRGELFQLDGYPGMKVRAEGDRWVRGEVHLLLDPSTTLPALDAYEGSEFERQVVTVLLDSGEEIQAWAYILAS